MKRRQALWMLGGLASCGGKEEREVMWRGICFGIPVSIRFRGVGEKEAMAMGDEGFRLAQEVERAASLWDEGSELRRLNREGRLLEPSATMVELLGKASALYEATGGDFDPSIHLYLEWVKGEYGAGREPDEEEAVRRRALVDFSRVKLTEGVELPEGMALSFNGIAQGVATDRVAEFLEGKVASALVNFGEYRVVGEQPWEVEVEGEAIVLKQALAVSSGSGERLSATSAANHLIDPKTGESPPPKRVVAVEAREAWLADGLATVVAMGGEVPDSFEGAKVYRFRK